MQLNTSRQPRARSDLASRLFLRFIRLYCRPRVEGLEHLPPDGPFILAPNHASHADTAVIFAVLPRHVRRCVVAAAAKDYFFENRLRGFVARTLFNIIPVERNARGGEDPLRYVVEALRDGYGVLLFPEGTRSASGELGEFRSGIGRLAAEFPDVPIIPVWLDGTARVLPKKTAVPIPRPARVTVRFGAPLKRPRPRLTDRATWTAFASQVRDAVVRLRDRARDRRAQHRGRKASRS